MSTLRNVKCGETAKVLKVTGSGPLKRRIMDMGITKVQKFMYAKLHL